jgi:hypothetical protein
MFRKLLLIGMVVLSIIWIIIMVWSSDDLSSDYNYVSAKLDIKKGDIKIINIGIPKITSKDKEIESVAARYGFKNIYIEKYSEKQSQKGIKNYNKVMEAYLKVRNGINWKTNYKREVDSLYKVALHPYDQK